MPTGPTSAQLAIMAAMPKRKKRRSKFGAIRTTVDGETFDSKAEARRHQELLLLQRAGLIFDLKRQVNFQLEVNGVKIATWRADWTYLDAGIDAKQVWVAEDKKSAPVRNRADSRMKIALFRALYPDWEVRLT